MDNMPIGDVNTPATAIYQAMTAVNAANETISGLQAAGLADNIDGILDKMVVEKIIVNKNNLFQLNE